MFIDTMSDFTLQLSGNYLLSFFAILKDKICNSLKRLLKIHLPLPTTHLFEVILLACNSAKSTYQNKVNAESNRII